MIKSYRELKNEYDKGIREFGAMSEDEKRTAKGLKLIKKLKQVIADIDELAKENNKPAMI